MIGFALGLYGLMVGMRYAMYGKAYGNYAGGAWALMDRTTLTVIIVFAYAAAFVVAAFGDRSNRTRYLLDLLCSS